MLSGKPLFPGRDYHHQLTLILDVLGTPSLDDFYQINSHRSRDYLRALPFKKKKKYSEMYPNAKPLAIDLMEKCLTFNPKKRITVEDGLAHPVGLMNARGCLPEGPQTDMRTPLFSTSRRTTTRRTSPARRSFRQSSSTLTTFPRANSLLVAKR
jgi:serine/threonine protein kinase